MWLETSISLRNTSIRTIAREPAYNSDSAGGDRGGPAGLHNTTNSHQRLLKRNGSTALALLHSPTTAVLLYWSPGGGGGREHLTSLSHTAEHLHHPLHPTHRVGCDDDFTVDGKVPKWWNTMLRSVASEEVKANNSALHQLAAIARARDSVQRRTTLGRTRSWRTPYGTADHQPRARLTPLRLMTSPHKDGGCRDATTADN